jgi:DHA1 family tetracycline resistance protein-like MFS transporter
MSTIWLVVFCDMLGFGVIVPSLPLYAQHYNATDFQVGLLFSMFSLCQFVAAPFLGLISDRHGRRPVLAVSQVGTVAGYVLLGWVMLVDWGNPTTALWLIILSRIIDGISGGNISTAQAYIADISTPQQRAARMGLLGAAFGIGFSAGPALGGLLSLWHPAAPAFGAAVLTGVACVMTFILLPESRRPGASGDDDASTESWMHPSRFMPVLRNPLLGQLIGIGFFSMMAFVMLEVVFALYLNRVFGFGQTGVNWFFAFVGVVIVVVQAGLIGKLTRAFGEWRLTVAGPLIATVSMALYAATAWHPLVGVLLLAALLNAAGRSVWFPTLNALISRSATPETQGVTFGVFHASMSLSRVIGPLIATTLFTAHVTGPFVVSGFILLATGLWALALYRRFGRRPAAEPAPAAAATEPA